jgi:hypothetical protein
MTFHTLCKVSSQTAKQHGYTKCIISCSRCIEKCIRPDISLSALIRVIATFLFDWSGKWEQARVMQILFSTRGCYISGSSIFLRSRLSHSALVILSTCRAGEFNAHAELHLCGVRPVCDTFDRSKRGRSDEAARGGRRMTIGRFTLGRPCWLMPNVRAHVHVKSLYSLRPLLSGEIDAPCFN